MTSANDLDAAIQRLKDALPGDVLPPDFKSLEVLVGLVPNLTPDVHRLYSLVGGTRSSRRLSLYLMSPKEAASTVSTFRDMPNWGSAYALGNAPFGDGREVLLLIDDNQSNYIGVHLKGAHANKAYLLDHDEPDTTPVFGSLAEVLNAMADGAGDDDLLDAVTLARRR